jgi:hypothetical protein
MDLFDADTALRAFRAFALGWSTGDFEPYVAMLADEVEFSFPEGDLRGHVSGAEGRARMIAKCRGHASAGERLRLGEPSHISRGGDTTVFEFVAEGVLASGYFRGEIAIAIAVRDRRVVGFREYYGFAG